LFAYQEEISFSVSDDGALVCPTFSALHSVVISRSLQG